MHCRLPPGITIRSGVDDTCLVATRHFVKGAILYQNSFQYTPVTTTSVHLTVVQEEGTWQQRCFVLQRATHAVTVSGRIRFYTFDSFINHSCDPSSLEIISDEVKGIYSVVALRDIVAGDQITQNYNSFVYDECNVGQCLCNTVACVGIVSGFRRLSPDAQRALLPHVSRDVLRAMTRDGWIYIEDLGTVPLHRATILAKWSPMVDPVALIVEGPDRREWL